MKYFLLPLGCAANKTDAERIAAVLEQAGFTPATSEQEADLIGVIACSIRKSAIDRVYGRARNWNKRKKQESLVTFVSGCILPQDKKKFLKIFDLVINLTEVSKLPQMLKEYGATVLPILPEKFWDIQPKRDSSLTALVPIQNGCNKFCTYCAVPYTRGREISRPSKDILKEISQLIILGYKQITLLGQNVNSYGLDKPKTELSFAQLLDKIGTMADQASQKIWIYYTSPHPQDMTEEVFLVQARHKSLANYLNFPLQSGNNKILKKMNRRYTLKKYLKMLSQARKIIPDLTVSTDMIVGFCGETKTQFKDSVQALKKANVDMAFIAQYSPRPGAVAEKRFLDDVPLLEKKRRYVLLTEVLKKMAKKKNQTLVNKTVTVFIETASRKKGKVLGRTQGLKSVELSGQPELIGQFKKVKITKADAWRLYGQLVF
ncbi:MAG: tRNA (N6-isopentenyl adenosine(37)-C2)-methylthiotransferase MiaB [Candidatus Kerfeldbacteria bacterium RIFOXYA2_FULL_38_24]|uniref:tRNA-2-methylthio-N(6)-dimethylallyladenosine synthase n=1 Tax=Candidatus Kerfeldbacteria bacterium RIFOXYB2_FULL_38_14 TaxID=1798547 RepID=A0A1G2BDK9_9BACT|nr:MAG: tRNA (N6-isopentenyl adenosine(37)-C2)-methylthiotransferase MiaB [Candidatus Kerfeldbacteria bacterium RIFOXYB2_FULL_38_14]OGY86492.1 MAG: tRNA (N6-isopentenyl adenosine(37)-C2)-methylthiotransferase MiaB [Candidatus Kerfeldbacteria bacterium RIFOXYA2_FULL_38_24]